MTKMQPAAVSATSWGWRHSGRQAWALSNLSFDIAPGERVLILGPSGSGKSTLMAGIAGLLGNEDEGEHRGQLLVDGQEPEAARGRIGLVMQDPQAQVVLAKVGDDVAFGLENLAVPQKDIWPRVGDAVNHVELGVDLRRSTSHLSGGQKQRLALASILAMQPGLILLDEPTANLDPKGAIDVRDAVQRVLDASGATLILVEHRLDIWAQMVDRVIVILDGKVAASGPLEEVLRLHADVLRDRGIWLPGDEVAREVTGDKEETLREPRGGGTPDAILRVRDLSIGYDAEHVVRQGINVDIPRGLSTCIVGENGAGKTTLALTLAGLLPSLGGTVSAAPAKGVPGGVEDPHHWTSTQLLGRISMVFQEPEYQFVARSVREELQIGPQKAGIVGEALDAVVNEYLRALDLESVAQAHPMTLSGGQKRRLSVATALISAPEILILDEPTFGQDRRTWVELVRLLQAARDRGTTLISITHDAAFAKAMCDNVVEIADLGEAVAGAEPQPVYVDSEGAPARKKRRVPLDAVNPVTHVLALIVMTTPLLASIDVVSAGVALILEFAFVIAAGMRVKTLALRMLPIIIAAPFASLSMLLYADPEASQIFWSFGPAMISARSVTLAQGIFLRVLALGMPAIVLLSRLDPTDMADGLTQILKFPARPVIASLAAARMTGLMMADWKALEQARRVRGIGDAGKITSAARGSFALLVFALRRSAKLSLTMESRGFGAPWPRTCARTSRLGAADAVMLAAAIAVPVIALSAAVATGCFEALI